MNRALPKKRLGVLISGGGSNLQALLNAVNSGEIRGEIAVVVSSNAHAYGLERAKQCGIPTFVAARAEYESAEHRDEAVLAVLKKHGAEYVILAGYLGIVSAPLLDAYPRRILNIHPALLPKFGGRDYYGLNVHRAVLAAGETESGATVHFVDAGVDTGLIIAQERLTILPDDTPDSLQARILSEIEHPLLVRTVRELCEDQILVENGVVKRV